MEFAAWTVVLARNSREFAACGLELDTKAAAMTQVKGPGKQRSGVKRSGMKRPGRNGPGFLRGDDAIAGVVVTDTVPFLCRKQKNLAAARLVGIGRLP
jgi:hypothetical protein